MKTRLRLSLSLFVTSMEILLIFYYGSNSCPPSCSDLDFHAYATVVSSMNRLAGDPGGKFLIKLYFTPLRD